MSLNVQLPPSYGYVLGSATVMFIVNTYHSMLTGTSRLGAGIDYPQCYATEEEAKKSPKAFRFNCAQRAHANYTENLTPVMTQMFISGLKYPVLSAGLGLGWALLRVVYAHGYAARGPKGRYEGIAHMLFDLALKVTTIYTTYLAITDN